MEFQDHAAQASSPCEVYESLGFSRFTPKALHTWLQTVTKFTHILDLLNLKLSILKSEKKFYRCNNGFFCLP